MLSPMHPKATTRLKATTFIRRGVSCYCMSHHTFQALSLWHQIHFVYKPSAYQVVDDQRQAYW